MFYKLPENSIPLLVSVTQDLYHFNLYTINLTDQITNKTYWDAIDYVRSTCYDFYNDYLTDGDCPNDDTSGVQTNNFAQCTSRSVLSKLPKNYL